MIYFIQDTRDKYTFRFEYSCSVCKLDKLMNTVLSVEGFPGLILDVLFYSKQITNKQSNNEPHLGYLFNK